MDKNPNSSSKEIQEIKDQILKSKNNFIMINPQDNSDEYVNFYFAGIYEGKEVIYDAVMYTLRLHYESEMYEIAEHKTAQRFPEFKEIAYEEDKDGNVEILDENEEEIGLFMAETIMELEEDGQVKVQEHVYIDVDFGLGIGLNVDSITPNVITSFVNKYNENSLELDKTMYSFETEDTEED